MEHDGTTVLLGIPIPSTDPVFLSIVGVHILFGIAAVTAGAVAMLSTKGRGRHSNWGTIYFWFLLGVFVTMSALSFMRWAENYHLFILGALSFASAFFGRTAVQRRWHQWPRLHLTGMGASYILLLTAFYVDNGKNLPLWRELPEIAFWFLPSAIGVPLILYALLRHPLVLTLSRSLPPTTMVKAAPKHEELMHGMEMGGAHEHNGEHQ
jgi:cell division protein FtsW (lipid II flippase)